MPGRRCRTGSARSARAPDPARPGPPHHRRRRSREGPLGVPVPVVVRATLSREAPWRVAVRDDAPRVVAHAAGEGTAPSWCGRAWCRWSRGSPACCRRRPAPTPGRSSPTTASTRPPGGAARSTSACPSSPGGALALPRVTSPTSRAALPPPSTAPSPWPRAACVCWRRVGCFKAGASTRRRNFSHTCYSDVLELFTSRAVAAGAASPTCTGGSSRRRPVDTYEYPVLTGVFIWFTGLFATPRAVPGREHAAFAPFAVLVAVLLHRMTGLRAAYWACAPALVLYALHNWDLLAVAAAVGGLYLWSRDRPVLAALLLGTGGMLKLYPALFLLPLVLDLLTRRGSGRAVAAAATGVAAVVLPNVPFALVEPRRLADDVPLPAGPPRGRDEQQRLVLGERRPAARDARAEPADRRAARPGGRRGHRRRAAAAAPRGGVPGPAGRAARCCARSCCSTRSRRRSTRSGCCRSSRWCGCGWGWWVGVPGRRPAGLRRHLPLADGPAARRRTSAWPSSR